MLRADSVKGKNLVMQDKLREESFAAQGQCAGAGIIPAPALTGSGHRAAGSAEHDESLFRNVGLVTHLLGRHGEKFVEVVQGEERFLELIENHYRLKVLGVI